MQTEIEYNARRYEVLFNQNGEAVRLSVLGTKRKTIDMLTPKAKTIIDKAREKTTA